MPGKFEPARKLFGEAMLIEEELKQKDESTGAPCLFIHHYSDGQVSLEELGMETEEIDLIECARSSLADLEKMAVKSNHHEPLEQVQSYGWESLLPCRVGFGQQGADLLPPGTQLGGQGLGYFRLGG